MRIRELQLQISDICSTVPQPQGYFYIYYFNGQLIWSKHL